MYLKSLIQRYLLEDINILFNNLMIRFNNDSDYLKKKRLVIFLRTLGNIMRFSTMTDLLYLIRLLKILNVVIIINSDYSM